MAQLEAIQNPIKAEIKKLNIIIDEALDSGSSLLKDVIKMNRRTHGKQIRPIIVLLTAKMFGSINDKALNSAAAIELLHNASLIHDDVIDISMQRRNEPTVNSVWNNHVAVLVGDFYLSTALNCSVSTNDLRIIKSISILGRDISQGEIDQIYNARYHNISEETYMQTIRRKTAALFLSCVEVGAYAVNAPEKESDKLKRFAEILGLIFQLKDDVFDYFDSKEVGKPTGNDLREGKITLPLIYALSQTSDSRSEAMNNLCRQETLTSEQIESLTRYAKELGGIEYTYSIMDNLKLEALELMSSLPDGEAKNALIAILNYTIERKN